jgi:hypothetical protein
LDVGVWSIRRLKKKQLEVLTETGKENGRIILSETRRKDKAVKV